MAASRWAGEENPAAPTCHASLDGRANPSPLPAVRLRAVDRVAD
jgi:hypothetical protein